MMNSRIDAQEDIETSILNDPAISSWLKQQINLSKERDVCDALSDAELLILVLNARLKKLLNS